MIEYKLTPDQRLTIEENILKDDDIKHDSNSTTAPKTDQLDQQTVDEAKKREILEKFGYKRNTITASDSEKGTCGKARRGTCC